MGASAAESGAATSGLRLSHRGIVKVFVGLMVGMLPSALSQTIVTTALPTMAGELGGLEYQAWVMSAYMMTSTVTVPLYGKLSDVYGRKRLFQIALVVFLVGSVLAGVAQSMGGLIAYRALQGIGGGGIITLAMAIIADVVSPRERGRYQGYITSVFVFASVAGPVLGGFFVDQLSWRWGFFVNIPLALVALAVTESNLNLPFDRQRRPIDYLGAAALIMGVSSLLLSTIVAEQASWGSPAVLGLLAAGVGLIVAFVRQQRRVAEPILPLELFANRVFTLATSLGLLTSLAMFAAIVFMPGFLQVALGTSATASGLLLAPFMGGILITSIGGGRLMTRLGRYRGIAIAGAALVLLGAALLSTIDVGTPPAAASAFVGIVGLGAGLAMPVLMVAIQNTVDVEHLGTATSAAHFSRTIGGVFGITLFGAVLNLRMIGSLEGSLPAGTDPKTLLNSPSVIADMDPGTQEFVRVAVADGVSLLFLIAVVFALGALALAWLLPDDELAEDAPVEVGGVA